MNTTDAPLNIATIKYKFIALYVVSIILLGVIITAILDPLAPGKASMAAPENSLADKKLSSTFKTFEENFQELYTLDKQYSSEKDPAKIAALNSVIESAERSLQKALDSLENGNTVSGAAVTTASISSITFPYKNALNLHKLFRSTSTNTASNDNSEALAKSRSELQSKEERIKDLESRLAASNSSSNSGSDKQVNELKDALEREVDRNKKLMQTSNTQKQTIEKLTKQVTSLQNFIHKM